MKPLIHPTQLTRNPQSDAESKLRVALARIDALSRRMDGLEALLRQLADKRGPGRPPKQEAA